MYLSSFYRKEVFWLKNIVITGSTRGIGFGLAKYFLSQNCKVTINGTKEENVTHALNYLKKVYPNGQVKGIAGDVTKYEDVEKLWDYAYQNFGNVDIWINNAGIPQERKMVWDISPDKIHSIFDVNVIGTIYGSKVAMNNMIKQGHGQIFNMEGFGSDGMVMEKMTLYGTTKRAVRYFTKSLIKEAKKTSVLVGTFSPGMVLTDFLTDALEENPEEVEKNKRIFNILADKVETVTPFLAERILNNTKQGAHINWLTKRKITWRFLSSKIHKRNLIE